MLSTNNEKEVYFHEYCKTCEYLNKKMVADPCNDCLDHPYNIDSHKPVHWKERDKK